MIRKREVYEVRYTERRSTPGYQHRGVIRASLRGAASRLAWMMLFDKYDGEEAGRYIDGEFVRGAVAGMECDCGHAVGNPGNPDYWDPAECPLHDRQSGYFRRLHDRLTTFIVSTIKTQEVTE